MNDKDLIEFFIYLRDHCYNRDFQIEPKKVVECFHEYRQQGYKLPIHAVSSQVCDCKPMEYDIGGVRYFKCRICGEPMK
jgi:hypothetical protein